jgi:hypothetical protein
METIIEKFPTVHGLVGRLGKLIGQKTGGNGIILEFYSPTATRGRFKDDPHDRPKSVYPLSHRL